MANDGGLIALLEQWFADQLAALQDGGADCFKTADIWRHQLSVAAGGIEALGQYEPCAFVAYQSADAAREGDYDLREVLEFAVLIGVESKVKGVARFGDATHLGISKIRDLVIALFDRKHPGDPLECDEIYYTGDETAYDSPRQSLIEMRFEVSKMTPVN